jgi:hypothetical protein
MAVLPDIDRARVMAEWMRDNTEPAPFSKVQLRNALDAADDWLDANIPAYVAALPAGFRTGSTAEQKAMLLGFVLWRRIGKLQTADDT